MSRRILGVLQLATLSLATLPACDRSDRVAPEPADAATRSESIAAATPSEVAVASTPSGAADRIDNHATAVDRAESPAPPPIPSTRAPRPVEPVQEEATAEPQRPATKMPSAASPMKAGDSMSSLGRAAAPSPPGGWGHRKLAEKDVMADGDGGEDYAAIAENTFVAVADDPRSTFSIDVDTASYSNMRRFLQDQSLPPADAVRIEELVNYFDYDYAAPEGAAPFSMTHEVSTCPWNDDHLLVHVGLQGKEIDDSKVPARNLVFLLDVSGSMNAPDKLPLLTRGLGMLVDNLRKDDRVSIVVYAGASGLVLEPTADKAEILAALGRLEAGGSTNGGAGIDLAYRLAEKTFIKGGINRVILATDGDFNVGTTSQSDLVKMIEDKRKGGVFLSVLGFGTGNVKDSTMEMLADKGNGNYAYIDSLSEARKVLVEEGGSTLVTIAKDVKIQVEFNPKEVASYRLVGYENRKLAHTDFNDDTKDAGEIGAGHSVTALYEVVPVGAKGPASPSVDPLKYQDTAPAAGTLTTAAATGELMTVKIRYKKPDGDKSDLLSFAVTGDDRSLDRTTDDFRFSAAVAEFGMVLRDRAHRGDATYDEVLALAGKSLGKDDRGHRAAFVRLVETAKTLDRRTLARAK
jgi:Ca-activated chloride channel family protein